MIYLIWCQSKDNRGISKNNKMPWYNKEELKHFYKTTVNHTVVMGYNTFASLNFQPLKDRENILFSSRLNCNVEGDIKVTFHFEEIIDISKNKKVFIIGGKRLFDIFMDYADKLIVSELNDHYDCDVFMDKIDLKRFKLKKQIKHKSFIVYNYDKI